MAIGLTAMPIFAGSSAPGRNRTWEHDWIVDVDKVAQLKRRSDERSELVFLCGVAARDSDVWQYFDVVCALIVDDETIRHRVKHVDLRYCELSLVEVAKYKEDH